MFKEEDYTCLSEFQLRELLSKDWEKIFLTISYVIVCNVIGILARIHTQNWIYYPLILIISSVFVAVIYGINYACQEYGALGIVLSFVILCGTVYILEKCKYGQFIYDHYQYIAFISAFVMLWKFFVFPIAEIVLVKKKLEYKISVDVLYIVTGILSGVWQLFCNCAHVAICFCTSFLLLIGICYGGSKHD